MALTDHVTSGIAAKYGRCTVLTNPSDGRVTNYDRQGVITVIDTNLNPNSPQTRAYFAALDARYLHNPSGWNE